MMMRIAQWRITKSDDPAIQIIFTHCNVTCTSMCCSMKYFIHILFFLYFYIHCITCWCSHIKYFLFTASKIVKSSKTNLKATKVDLKHPDQVWTVCQFPGLWLVDCQRWRALIGWYRHLSGPKKDLKLQKFRRDIWNESLGRFTDPLNGDEDFE